MSELISLSDVESKVLAMRGQQVLIDRDVAELYGVETKKLNQAVSRNLDKFPDGYILSVSSDEKSELVTKCDHLNVLKYSSVLPTAFTEKGLYMLATILKSPKATETTIAIVETFAKIRELAKVMDKLPDEKDENQQKELLQKTGAILADVLGSNELGVTGTETTLELNLALVKVKHVVKRGKG